MTQELKEQSVIFLNYLRNIQYASPKTVAAYSHDLTKFLEFLAIRDIYKVGTVTENHVEEFLSANSKGDSPANFSRKLYAIKGFLKFLKKRGFKIFDLTLKAPRNHRKNISYLSQEEVRTLLDVVQNSHLPYFAPRDTAIVSLLLNTGIRVSELTNLKVRDFELRPEAISYISITRKGGDESKLPVNKKTAEKIKTYLLKRNTEDSQPLFLSRRGKPIKQNTIYSLVKHYLQKAGIKKEKMGPHVLRHTVGTTLRARGVDLVVIQKLLGHNKLETTSIYMHVEPKDLENAVISLNY